MNDAPAISLASKDPRRTDLEYRPLRMAWTLEARFLTMYNVAEVPVYVRRNSLDRQGPLGVLRTRPVESAPDLIPTVVTSPAGDAEKRDVGGTGPEGLEGLCAPSKQFGFCLGDLVEKRFELCMGLSASLRSAH